MEKGERISPFHSMAERASRDATKPREGSSNRDSSSGKVEKYRWIVFSIKETYIPRQYTTANCQKFIEITTVF